jgi:hypothetical protein
LCIATPEDYNRQIKFLLMGSSMDARSSVIRTCRAVAPLLLVVAVTAGPAAAQDVQSLERLERQLRQAEREYLLQANPLMTLNERAMVDYGALLTAGFLAIDDESATTRILRQYDAQLYGYLSVDGVHEAFGRLRFTYRDFNEGDSFDGNGDELDYPLGDRWWYRFSLRNAIERYEGRRSDIDLRIQVGRQYVDWASGVALSEQLYAGRAWLELGPDWTLQGLIGATPSSTVIDFDSSRPSFDGDTDRLFVGGQVTYRGFDNHAPYFYVLHQEDNNDEDFANILVDVGGLFPVPFATRFDYNSTYWGVGSTGRLSGNLTYEVEGILETGNGLSNSFDPANPANNITQTRDDIWAWAARGELTYRLNDANQTRFMLESILASGDDDRALHTSNTFGGNAPGTDDNAFNAFGFQNTGLAFAAPISNLAMVRLGASTYPWRESNWTRRLQVGIDLFAFGKMDSDAPIDEPTSNDMFVGWETDVYANWRLASDVAVFFRYAVFFPGEAIQGDNDERHFFYSGVTYSF